MCNGPIPRVAPDLYGGEYTADLRLPLGPSGLPEGFGYEAEGLGRAVLREWLSSSNQCSQTYMASSRALAASLGGWKKNVLIAKSVF